MRKITLLVTALLFSVANSQQTTPEALTYTNSYSGQYLAITNVTFTGDPDSINNTTTWARINQAGYGIADNDYTSQKVSLEQGTTSLPYSITGYNVLIGYGYPMNFGILIDFNQDGSYDSSEIVLQEAMTESSSSAPFNYTGTLTLPSTLAVSDYNIRVMIGDFNGASYLTGTGSLSYGELEVYTLSVTASASVCNPPTSGVASNITATGATIGFTAATGNDSFSYTVYSGTDTTATPFQSSTVASAAEISSSEFNLSGLSANSEYTVVITASCDGTNAISDLSVNFTTLCDAVALPYTNSFESGFDCFANTSSTPWLIGTAATTNEGANPTVPSDGSSYAYFDDYNYNAGNTADLITPPIDISSVSSASLTFDYFDYSATNGDSVNTDTVAVYVIDATGTYNLAYTTAASVTDWTTQEVDLSSYVGQIIQIAFRGTSVWGYSAPSIDNLSVSEGSVCGAPSVLEVSNTTTTTATYSWTFDSSNDGVSYNTTDSSGAYVASASGFTDQNTVDVTGLSPNTTYTITLTGACGSQSSANTISTTFNTSCNVYTIPFSEGFETGYTSGSNIGPTGGNGNNCFTEEQAGSTTSYAYAYNGTVSTLVTPNTGDWSGFAGTSATDVWYFFDVALTGGVSYTASLYARASSALSAVTEGSVSISYGASASAADMTTQVVAPSVLGTSYELSTGEFTPTSDGTYTFGVNVVHDGAFGGYLNFDDLSIIETPSCTAPSNVSITSVTTSSATYTWDAGTGNTDYSYSTTDSDGNEVASASGTSTSGAVTVDVTGLSSNTTYTVTVTGVCGSDSAGTASGSFTTTCGAAIAGFSQNFNGLDSMPSCWTVSSGGDPNTWIYAADGFSLGGLTQSGGVIIYYNAAAHDDYLYSPPFSVIDGVTDGFSFNAQSGLSNYPEPLDISVVNISTGETTLILDDYEVGTYEYAFHSEFYDLSAFEGQDIKISFHTTTQDMNYILLDNFVVGSASTMADGWAGFQDGDYSNAQNWFAGSVPTGDVTLNPGPDVASYNPFIISEVNATSLTVNTGVTLTLMEPAGSLQTTGDFTNNGTVNLTSPNPSISAHHPSLIVGGTSTGTITYNRYVAADRWYVVSSPVSGQGVDSFISAEQLAVSTNNSSLVALADYNNDGSQYAADPTITTGWWDYHQAGDDGTFTSGQGKIARLASDATDNLLGFTGTISGSVSVPMTVATTAFNLIGNPYPAAVQVTSQGGATNDALSANTSVLSEETAWFWNGAENRYTAVNQNPSQAAKITAPGQGFFVSAAGSGDFSFTTAMQTTSASSFNRQAEWSKIDLSMSAGTQSSETEIVYFDGATTGWDNGYDSTNWSSGSFQIFTSHVDTSTSQNLAIQSLPLGNFNDMVVPVGVNASAGQMITISVDTTNWPEGVKIYLEDVDNDSYTLLDGQNAEFTTLLDSNESGIGRFYIHTTSNSLGDDDLTLTDVSIYASSRDNLRILGINSGEANVQMFDLMGKQVLNTSFNGQSVNDVKLPNLNTGIYLVNLASDEGTINKKIIIQ